jgi:adenylate cyclase class 2
MEHEAQVLDIDKEAIANKLRGLGAKETPEVLQRRWVYGIQDKHKGDLNDEWVRLRDSGDKTTITYKYKHGKGISETEEIEVKVDDFDKTIKLLSKLKFFNDAYYQENKRHTFELNGIEFTLDTWPKIPPVLEVEAESEEKVKEGLKLVGFEEKDVGHAGFLEIYANYGIELHTIKELKFDD